MGVKAGQPWKPPRAAQANATAAAVEAWRRTPQSSQREQAIAGTVVNVRNDAGKAMRRGDVMLLTREALLSTTSTDREHPWIAATKISAATVKRNAIPVCLLDPLPKTHIGEAQIVGICMVWVNVIATWHPRAYPQNGTDVMDSGLFGPAEILIEPEATGEQLCLCNFGARDNAVVPALTIDEIPKATLNEADGYVISGVGTVEIFDPKTFLGYYDHSTHEVEAYNFAGGPVSAGKHVLIAPTCDWLPFIVVESCAELVP